MPYRWLECSNEKIYRWHEIDDSKDVEIVQEKVKKDIAHALTLVGIGKEQIEKVLEKYIAPFIAVQTIFCPSCKTSQLDVIVDDKLKLREDLWRSYETARFVALYVRGNNDRI